MKNLLFPVLIFIILFCIVPTLRAQSGPSFIIQLREGHTIDSVYNYFSKHNISLQGKSVAESIRAWMIRPEVSTRQSYGWENLLDQCLSIEIWQPNRTYHIRSKEPNDPQYSEQWYLKTIKMPKAWDYTTGEVADGFPAPVVGVLEPGLTMDRPDFEDIIFINPGEIPGNGIDDDGNGYIDDVNGWNIDNENGEHLIDNTYHGDAVIGIIAARGNNGTGITGLNWSGKILPMSAKEGDRITDAATIVAYEYFYRMRKLFNETNGEKGSFVVATNSSFGKDGLFEEDAPLFCTMYEVMGSVGIISVGATSNQDVNVDLNGDLPSNCSSEHLIIVNSIDRSLENNTSGRGVENVDLAAPGEKIPVMHKPGEFKEGSGTSFATPQISGIISLAYSLSLPSMRDSIRANPVRVADVVKACILNTTTPAPDLADENKTGGYLNAHKTLECVYNHYYDAPEDAKAIYIHSLYPNAAYENIYVNYEVADLTKSITYTLFDILGRKISMGEINPLSDEIPSISVYALPGGVYVLSLKQGKHMTSKKFIKMQ